MSRKFVSPKRTASVISALVTMLLALGVAGLTASPASADDVDPSAPQNVALTWDGTTSLVATWDEPTELGADPDEYYVHLEGEDADGNPDVDIDQFIPYVSGDAEYDFGSQPTTNSYFVSVVLFDNVDGSGEYAYADTPAFPLTPSDITLWSTGQNVTINWFQPQDYADTSFAVTLDGGSYHEAVETDDADWSGSEYGWADFAGVPVGTYTATVTATNVSGDGPTATQTLLVVDGHDVPSAARSVTASNSSPHKVTVNWDAPASDGGEPVSNYTVSVYDEGDASYAIVSGTSRSVTIEADIKNGTWPVKVWAENAKGYATAAGETTVTVADAVAPVATPPAVVTPPVVVTPVVVEAVPSAVTKADATKVKKGGVVTLDWKAPKAVAGAAVTRYTITVANRVQSVKTTKGTVRGLRAGTYKMKIRAISKNGASKAVTVKVKVAKSVAAAAKPALRSGDDSTAVKKLQKALDMRVKARSGEFDKATVAAVKAWQKSHGLKRTGMVNDAMRFALNV
jgi:hypothetical protein